ncbi:hypothetical protein ACI7YT_12710 [Microbacterium sp. M]|uniref:hypothetical protein n=1 Tax=Microbacterium sp. M TaxID=3377125 RepID=UPI00386B2231
MARGWNGRPTDQGAGYVHYHDDRRIIHFASTADEIAGALLAQKIRASGFEVTGRMPS